MDYAAMAAKNVAHCRKVLQNAIKHGAPEKDIMHMVDNLSYANYVQQLVNADMQKGGEPSAKQ